MAHHDFIPGREINLRRWSASFDTQINIDPVSFSLTVAQAAAYTVLNDSFSALFIAANRNISRTPSVVVAKNDAKRALIAEARRLARIIQASPSVTNQQRTVLGLTIPDEQLTPLHGPALPPNVSIVSTMPRAVKIRLDNKSNRSRRGKPRGTVGAILFSYVGEDPAPNFDEWVFRGNTTRHLMTIRFPASIPAGSKVWLTAQWLNTRLEPGPASTAVSVRMIDGIAKAA